MAPQAPVPVSTVVKHHLTGQVAPQVPTYTVVKHNGNVHVASKAPVPGSTVVKPHRNVEVASQASAPASTVVKPHPSGKVYSQATAPGSTVVKPHPTGQVAPRAPVPGSTGQDASVLSRCLLYNQCIRTKHCSHSTLGTLHCPGTQMVNKLGCGWYHLDLFCCSVDVLFSFREPIWGLTYYIITLGEGVGGVQPKYYN